MLSLARNCKDNKLKFLARQGLAFRGHKNDDGNFKQLLLVRSEDNVDLQQWLSTRNDIG
jgi:hypothetical protein